MCNVFCKEFKGWCRSFTRLEAVLATLQALLLAVLVGFLAFLTLHFLVCSSTTDEQNILDQNTQPGPGVNTSTHIPPGPPYGPNTSDVSSGTTTSSPDPECTWEPSKKTKATTHYYWTPSVSQVPVNQTENRGDQVTSLPATTNGENSDTSDGLSDKFDDNPDGTDAPQSYKDYVAALVKLKLPTDVTYGCILTKVTRYWTLTAASCIESIEEVDSLDSFFITETYGEVKQGLSHALADVRIHPLYQGANRSYDLAALQSAESLAPSTAHLLQLPTFLEYFLLAPGEKFTVLGYGGYRTIDKSPTGRRLRQVATYTVSTAQCGAVEGADAWAPRHLTPGRAAASGECAWCGATALCAAARGARAAPCAYCGGAPLLREGRLYGVMADNRQCGVTCEPVLYVNIAAMRKWIDSVVH